MDNRNIERIVIRMYESFGDDVLELRFTAKDVSKIARALDGTFQDAARLLVTSASEAKVVTTR